MNGCVTKTFHDKAYGFIKGDDGKEYFLHRSSILNFYVCKSADFYTCVKVGMFVEFTPTTGPYGLRAIEVLLEVDNSAESNSKDKAG